MGFAARNWLGPNAPGHTPFDRAELVLQIQDQERRRIASELHDSTAQQLAAVNLKLELLKRHSIVTNQLSSEIDEVTEILHDATKEIRALSFLLYRPGASNGLIASLTALVNGFGRRAGTHIEFHTELEERDIPKRMHGCLMRLTQECLSNVHRHANASMVTINLDRTAAGIALSIQDNGVGNKGQAVDDPVAGVGLESMQERVQELGGTFRFDQRATGTRVIAAIPIRQAAQASRIRLA